MADRRGIRVNSDIITDSQSTENISLFHAYARKNNMCSHLSEPAAADRRGIRVNSDIVTDVQSTENI